MTQLNKTALENIIAATKNAPTTEESFKTMLNGIGNHLVSLVGGNAIRSEFEDFGLQLRSSFHALLEGCSFVPARSVSATVVPPMADLATVGAQVKAHVEPLKDHISDVVSELRAAIDDLAKTVAAAQPTADKKADQGRSESVG